MFLCLPSPTAVIGIATTTTEPPSPMSTDAILIPTTTPTMGPTRPPSPAGRRRPRSGTSTAPAVSMTAPMSGSNASGSANHRRSAAAAVALLALLRPSQAFVQRAAPLVSGGTSSSTSSTSSSSLNFREPTTNFSFELDTSGDTQTQTQLSTAADADAEQQQQMRSRLPTWLQTAPQTSAEAELALSTLRDAMVSSYLTPSEASAVLAAIQHSAPHHPSKLGGAAQFCHILVDTMEMGVTSLIAAVRHYCECYDVREHEARHGFSSGGTTLLPSGASLEMFEMAARAFASSEANLYGGGSTLYPPFQAAAHKNDRNGGAPSEAARIASDASGLKRTEAVARTTFRGGQGSRRDAHANMHMQNLLLSETRDWRALAIRTAACLYRLRGLQAPRDGGAAPAAPLTSEEVRQCRDALHIYAPLASRLGMHRLKNELESAAFRLQYRRQYDRVMDLGREPFVLHDDNTNGNPANCPALTVGEGMARVLRRVATNVKAVLDADAAFAAAADDVVVSARVKEPYSLWRKILRTGAARLLDVPDALALRVVLNARKESASEPPEVTAARERALCYYVQSLCSAHWEPDLNSDGGRFKDYIDKPKPNGYQSLHYTASTWWGGQDWPLEIQVRTGEMHKIAEYGLAAHFDYKENAKRGKESSSSSAPVNHRTRAGSRAHANLHSSSSSDAQPPSTTTRSLNDETYLQAVQEWHWNQIDGAAYSSSPSSFEEVQGEPSTKIGTGYSPDHDEDRAQRVRARAERIAPYIESFTAARSDLARNHVFVFLASSEQEQQHRQQPAEVSSPSGTIVSLPSGSCILDALREGAKHFPGVDSGCFQGKGDTHGGVRRNGMAAASVTEMLKNGDVITLPVVCNAGEVLTP